MKAIELEVATDAENAGRRAASILASVARETLVARERFVVALSGGKTPETMFRAFAEEDVDWGRVHVLQVDERIAPPGDPERNWGQIEEELLSRVPIAPEHMHPMPVEARDLEAAARRYAGVLRELAGDPPEIDCVHLGLGADGHTASLVPGDPILDNDDADVGLTEIYHGRRRMSLTFPALHRARRIVWLVSGASKVKMLERLLRGDRTIPAGRVPSARAVVVADALAVKKTETENDS
ncbi:MAG: 6-phosphogluconolactonase [Acidobacteriota bacterium]|nr:MAG: 6-phosphogluconolactonase [Acidobacteriota bacterium]